MDIYYIKNLQNLSTGNFLTIIFYKYIEEMMLKDILDTIYRKQIDHIKNVKKFNPDIDNSEQGYRL